MAGSSGSTARSSGSSLPPAGRRRWLVPLGVAGALAVGVGLGALLFGGDDDGSDGGAAAPATTAAVTDGGDDGDDGDATTTSGASGPSTTAAPVPTTASPPSTIPVAGLEGDAAALAEAINRASQLTYRATYRTVAGTADQTTTVEVYRRLPFARRDTYVGEGERALHTSEFLTPDDGHVGCLVGAQGSNETFCVIAPGGGVSPADPVIGAVDPRAGTVAATDETIAGVASRCFRVTGGDQVVHLACFDDEGVPSALDGGDGLLERVLVERAVPDDVFVVPSQPTAAPGSP